MCSSEGSQSLAISDVDSLIELFNELFAETENTRLVKGSIEPVYLPADDRVQYHRIVFAHGFFASALHEIAHWCIAGKQRRLQEDYGYWYAADGRTPQQQARFESVEVKPQALEWLFSKASRQSFRVSVDNLSGEQGDSEPFKRAVYQQLQRYCEYGLPPRAQLFIERLAQRYATELPLVAADFELNETR
jgi:elongation factor P hydroxylase